MSTSKALVRSPAPTSTDLTSHECAAGAWGTPFGSRKIRPKHGERLAIVYVRQSTPHQVLENRESTERQYNPAGSRVRGLSPLKSCDKGGIVMARSPPCRARCRKLVHHTTQARSSSASRAYPNRSRNSSGHVWIGCHGHEQHEPVRRRIQHAMHFAR